MAALWRATVLTGPAGGSQSLPLRASESHVSHASEAPARIGGPASYGEVGAILTRLNLPFTAPRTTRAASLYISVLTREVEWPVRWPLTKQRFGSVRLQRAAGVSPSTRRRKAPSVPPA